MAPHSGPGFLKGHGTGNDFVVLANLGETLSVSEDQVRRLCDRRFGLGADGVLIVSPASQSPIATDAAWFMDYRNADGSLAEMCGNGARLFGRYLYDYGLVDATTFLIATRGGDRTVSVAPDGSVRVEMGVPTTIDDVAAVLVDGIAHAADCWWIPNPHAVVFVEDTEALAVPLPDPVVLSDVFPDGRNVEYVQDMTPSISGAQLHARMRVHERGVGETSSCGTGACAVSLSMRARYGVTGDSVTIVDVPGGRLEVSHGQDDVVSLSGPVAWVATGTIDRKFWEEP